MNDDDPGVQRHLSRRKFLYAAGGAGVFSAGLLLIGARRSATETAPFVLSTATDDVTPFKVDVSQSALNDLKDRLSRARWPDKEPVTDWSQGVPLAKARALVDYWRARYDWRLVESALNALPQFRTRIDGLGIHFIHVRSKHENALPIILTHGWPGSVLEFLQITLYWLTDTAASSARLYHESFANDFVRMPLELPAAVSIFKGDVFTPPKVWGEQTYSKLFYWNEVPKGGHFAALEQPELFVAELRKSFARMR